MSLNSRKYFYGMLIITSVILLPHQSLAQEKEKDNETFIDWVWNWWYGDDVIEEEPFYQSNHSTAYDNLRLQMPIAGLWKFNIGDNLSWKNPDYPDKNWQTIKVPEDWENQGFNGYDGFAWYRLHFDGSKLRKRDVNYLILGFIDDVDETYVNGQLVGKSGAFPPRFRTAYNATRKYMIPNELINFNGDNVIAVRVYDDYKNGGICGGDMGFYAAVDFDNVNLLQNLAGLWYFNDYNSRSFSKETVDESGWDKILVPDYWDNHGYRALDGVGWYRKSFELDFQINPNETYYLVLGKIDDFDETWLNGEKIGETNDQRPFGASESYKRIRLYKIPKGLLKEGGMNSLAIKVIDIGREGGIYEGLIGIVEASGLTAVVKAVNRN
jgi:sialate O-acetylesterase